MKKNIKEGGTVKEFGELLANCFLAEYVFLLILKKEGKVNFNEL